MKQGNRLRIFVDGAKVATSASFDPARYDLSAEAPLAIGFGPQDVFNGRMRDFRFYNRALTEEEIGKLWSR